LNDLPIVWHTASPTSSERVDELRLHAAELDLRAKVARTDHERRTFEILAKMYQGTAQSFVHLEAFRAMLDEPLTARRQEKKPTRV
jgi:hypothetical protein